jgi:hypothetical protein
VNFCYLWLTYVLLNRKEDEKKIEELYELFTQYITKLKKDNLKDT